ncbi:uncharacterized protein LOC131803914 [Musca domestica]|uniref:Uncharacterized protein LOC131803914 n=1 Tax=Musca domestica TaxID=7370 RepID=A0ABM3V7P5_MUSDO|nr:uncharacterized protein LOC131803914 [Musca domestica]
MTTSLKNCDIFLEWLEVKDQSMSYVLAKLKEFIEDRIGRKMTGEEHIKVKNICYKLSSTWKKYYRKRDKVEMVLKDWFLMDTFKFDSEPDKSTSRDRPRIIFEESSCRTKRRRVGELVASTSADIITTAAKRFSNVKEMDIISVEKALALYVDMDLSVRQYNMMRNAVNAIHKNCFPSYYAIAEAKKKLIPENIEVTETSMNVPLQRLLDNTAKSILTKLQICHKIIRSNRLKHTRKCGRVESNRDLIQYLILQSDPVISLNSHNILARNYNMEDIKSYICEENNLNIPEICSEDESDDCSEVCSE